MTRSFALLRMTFKETLRMTFKEMLRMTFKEMLRMTVDINSFPSR